MSSHRHPVDPGRVDEARARALGAEEAEAFAELLGVIGEPVRARIVSALLATREMCVGDLAIALELSEDAVSYGLRLLRARGLVERRSVGRLGYYRLVDGPRRAPLAAALARLGDLSSEASPPPGDKE